MPVTIRDVARLAGCSIKTVSRVINNEPNVSEETRAKVNAAIRGVGYAPNISARRLAQNKSYMICLLLDPRYYQQGAELLLRIMDIGFEEDYDIMIQPYSPQNDQSKRKLVAQIYEQRIDGFVITPPLDADTFVADMLATYKVPQVQITPLKPEQATPYIDGEDYRGAYMMTEHLLGLGHRRIAFLRGGHNLRASEERAAGFTAALSAAGVQYDETLVRDSDWTFESGYRMIRLFCSRVPAPTAIFAGSDEAAYGVMYAAQELGLKIPDQLSVCGYGDLNLSKSIWPGLTTVHQPIDEMIERAVRLMIGLLKGHAPGGAVSIQSKLVIRGSTAAPSSSQSY